MGEPAIGSHGIPSRHHLRSHGLIATLHHFGKWPKWVASRRSWQRDELHAGEQRNLTKSGGREFPGIPEPIDHGGCGRKWSNYRQHLYAILRRPNVVRIMGNSRSAKNNGHLPGTYVWQRILCSSW